MKRKKYNEEYFEVIDTEDKAYFLGFIAADGSIKYNKERHRYCLVIKIHPKDVDVLEKFIDCIDGEMSVWFNTKRDICQVHISGKKIVKSLIRLGIVPDKTKTLTYPSLPINLERHFLRGFFDGDGCIRINKDKRDGSERGDLRIVCASKDMINSINERMNSLFGCNINKLYGPKDKDFKYIGWAGMTDIENIYNGFYHESTLYLDRKRIIFDGVMDIINNKKKYRKK